MFPRATDHHYRALQVELQNNNAPDVWVKQMCDRLDIENPVIAQFLYQLLERFQGRPWFPHAVHCACAMYRLLELASGTLPRVKREVGAPMAVELARDSGEFQATWVKRLVIENPRANTILADYMLEYISRGGTEATAAYVSWAGVVVYQYLARQAEANELAALPLA